MPNSHIVVKNGEDIRVPSNKEEAAVQNILLVSQFRVTLQNALKHYKDKEMIPTPRELNDMASAIQKCNEACSAVFEKVELPMEQTSPQKKEEETPLDFSKMVNVTEKKEETKPDGN